MRPDDLQPPQYGTSMHYPSCIVRSCTGCFPPLPQIEEAEPVASPFHQPEPEATAQPTPPRAPAPRGIAPEKWAVMNRAERRAHKSGRSRS